MPVNEATLQTTIDTINSKIQTNAQERQKLRQLLDIAESIKQVDVPDPTPQDLNRTKKIMPKDRVLGKDITPARRQEIYDKIVADVAVLP